MEHPVTSLKGAFFFDKAHTDFSLSFKEQLLYQLQNVFNQTTEIPDFFEKRNFSFLVGMQDLKIMYKDGYGFGLLEICTPTSFSYVQTFFWKTANVEDAFKKDIYTKENIVFGFCADFEKDHFKSFKKRKVVRIIKGQKLKFKYIEELNNYPDMFCAITLNNLPNSKESIIVSTLLKNRIKEAYISEITTKENKLTLLIDFQLSDFKEAKKQWREFIIELNQSEFSHNIELIIVD